MSHDDGQQALINRLNKNRKHLSRWIRREGIACYRLYDADIPEYAVAIDVYESGQRLVHLQEYQAPKQIDPEQAARRLQQAVSAAQQVLEVPGERLFVKVRQQQKGKSQYERLSRSGQFHPVSEGGHRFWVNLADYLDTGLFLDHRITRGLVQQLAGGRRFLNLFAYTASATVYAAAGGASQTVSVDLSRTYLDWAKRNFALNGMDDAQQHQLVQADCLRWLEQAVADGERFGLVFLDPPSFSTSKRMRQTFDVQRDHVPLIEQAAALLEADGVLIFSNNRRNFRMDDEALAGLRIENISAQTLPVDYKRNPRIHNCWRIERG